MKTLHYSVEINAPKQNVWDTMLDPQKYNKWASAFSVNSQFVGEWRKDNYIRFIDPDQSRAC